MGNYKFRFSDMIPNAWFHKLKDMSKPKSNYNKTLKITKKKPSSPPPLPSAVAAAQSLTLESTKKPSNLSDQRKSYYFTRDLTLPRDSDKRNPQQPRKSARRRRRRCQSVEVKPPSRLVSSAACSCRLTFDDSPPSPEESTNSGQHQSANQSSSSELDSVMTEYGSDKDRDWTLWSSPCKCQAKNDIVIDIIGYDHRRLPPIITNNEDSLTTVSPIRRLPVKATSPGVKLRLNSPKMRIQGRRSVSSNSSSSSRRSISDSFAVVKTSRNPGRDFEESMVEMIVENNIRASKDLEELLACYLTLNSDEYHDLIINVFKQIWFDFIHLRLK